MSLTLSKVQWMVNYYAREGYGRHVQMIVGEVLAKRPDDPLLKFWHCYGLVCEKSLSEALRELDALRDSNVAEVGVATLALMAIAHRGMSIVDSEAVEALETQLEMELETAGEGALLLLANLLWLADEGMKARDICERMLTVRPHFAQALSIMGWVDLGSAREDEDPAALKLASDAFDMVLGQPASAGDVDAMLGKAEVLKIQGRIVEVPDLLEQMTSAHPWFFPAILERAKVLLGLGDWDSMMRSATRVLEVDPQNIGAERLVILNLLAREGKQEEAAERIEALATTLARNEPKNAGLNTSLSCVFSRLAGKNADVLRATMSLMEAARALEPSDASIMNELAFQKMLVGDLDSSRALYNEASAMDDLNVDTLYGGIRLQLLRGDVSGASSQLEFLNEMGTASEAQPGQRSQLHYLNFLLLLAQGDTAGAEARLDKAVEDHAEGLEAVSADDIQYFVKMNPEYMMDLVRGHLTLAGAYNGGSDTNASRSGLNKALEICRVLLDSCPGLTEAMRLMSLVMQLSGDVEGALLQLRRLLTINPDGSHTETHESMAKIYSSSGNFRKALDCLERALARNFEVRESIVFGYVRAKVLLDEGHLDKAQIVIEGALELPGVRKETARPGQLAKAGTRAAQLSLQDRCNVFMLAAEIYSRQSNAEQVENTLRDATKEFGDTPEEVRITLAISDTLVSEGNTDDALRMLQDIPASSPHWVACRLHAAKIHLEGRNDRRGYLDCYRELMDRFPSVQNRIRYGEACMKVSEPDLAVKALKLAYGMQGGQADPRLGREIARALVMTHEFTEATVYFEEAARATQNADVIIELSELYRRLGKLPEAEEACSIGIGIIEREGNMDRDTLGMMVRALSLMAQILRAKGDPVRSTVALKQARDVQARLVEQVQKEDASTEEDIAAARRRGAEMSIAVAEDCERLSHPDAAREGYEEALKFMPGNESALLALASLALREGDEARCQAQCSLLLQADPNHEAASMMLAELMFRKEDFETALFHFKQILDTQPCNYGALCQLIHLARRSGKLDSAEPYVKAAVRASPRPRSDPGLNFCQGTFKRLVNDPRASLAHLNVARKDTQWGVQAVYAMVEIFLNPDGTALAEATNLGTHATVQMDKDGDVARGGEGGRDGVAARLETIAGARKLLTELQNRIHPEPIELQGLNLLCFLAESRNREDVSAILDSTAGLLKSDEGKDNAQLLLILALCCVRLDQQTNAKNHLKRVQKLAYRPDQGEYFEHSWLMLAGIYAGTGQTPLAEELCNKCLKYNQACGRAWETLGMIKESAGEWREAAEMYDKGWAHAAEQSPALGYKLAFNYMRAEQPAKAIDVCNKVIAKFPNYPKIKKEILSKAVDNLRA